MRKTVRFAAAILGVSVLAAGCDRGVVDPPGHHDLETVQILNHQTEELLATWTHDGGWDTTVLTSLSHADEANRTRLVLRARMWTEDGDEISLTEGGEYSVQYQIAEGGDPTGIIDMDVADLFHGNHVYVYAHEDRTGTAQLEFHLYHGGHSDGATDPIGLTVTD
jgi:hypothetical protein